MTMGKRIEEPRSPAEFEAMSVDDKHLLMAQRNADLYTAELNRVAQALAQSYLMLGNHDEALAAASIAGNDDIEAAIAAIELDDEERCECAHEIEVTLPNKKTETRPAANYLKWDRMWSPKHEAWVTLHRCFKCGHMQAIPGEIDQLHADIHAAVDLNHAQAQIQLETGQRADLLKDHEVLPVDPSQKDGYRYNGEQPDANARKKS